MLPGAVGLMQATEVIKLVLGEGLPMIGRLLLYDAMKMSFRGSRFAAILIVSSVENIQV